MSVIASCVPRSEVLDGELDDAIFAANLSDLVSGTAKPVYANAATFFQNTHPARQLREIAQQVFRHLSDPAQGGIFSRLSTGFGGGKTHALMTLWHLAKNAGDPSIGSEIVPVGLRPASVTVVAIDFGAAGVPNFAQHDDKGKVIATHSLWGETAWQLRGAAGVAELGEGEAPDRQPNREQIAALFPEGPVLILLDELVMYMANLRDIEQKALLNFVNKLINICASRPQTALIISDPASQALYASQSAELANVIKAAQDAGDLTGRTATDLDPIGDESSQVIVRRLFSSIDQNAATDCANSYHALYQRLVDPSSKAVPDEAARDAYRQEIIHDYPFHPRLMQTTRDRLNSIAEYNRSRGTLRLFARLVRSTFKNGMAVDLISGGDVDWSDPHIVTELLARLNRDAFSGAVNTDIGQHAAELDGGARGVHTRVASALLLESLQNDLNAGLTGQELTLAVLRPDEAGPEPVEAMERLISQCWFTYRLDSGQGWQFRTEPNVNQMIAQRAPGVPEADALARVHAEAQGYFQGALFKVVPWPQGARQVPDTAKLQLALCDSVDLAKSIASLGNEEDDSPRQYRNAIVAVAPAKDPLDSAVSLARRVLAAEQILAEYKTGDAGKKIRDQIEPLLTSSRRDLGIQSRRAFSNVVLADKQVRPIEEQFQVPKDSPLANNVGQANLSGYLEAKSLIYGPGASLDVDLFIDRVLPGATPNTQVPGSWAAKAIHERILSAPNMRLVRDEGVTRRTLTRALEDGRISVRLADGSAYDKAGAVTGPEGRRVREAGAALPQGFLIDDTTLVAVATEPVAKGWLAESDPEPVLGAPGGEPGGSGGPPPPPPPPAGATRTTSWEEAQKLAQERSLRMLTLEAATPVAAGTLVPLAGPLGANKLKITVGCNGTAKSGGGRFRLLIEEAPINHPSNPVAMASTIYNSLDDAGRSFTVRLTLDFGEKGRDGAADALKKAAEGVADGVTMMAEFAAPAGVKPALEL